MITFKGLILNHHKKEDGTWNVKIRVTANRKSGYLSTNIFVNKKQLNTKQTKITDQTTQKKIDNQIEEYRGIVTNLANTSVLTPSLVIEYIKKAIDKKSQVDLDFIVFGKKKIKKLLNENKIKTANGYKTVINSLQDFFKSEKILITDITAKSLLQYEEFLKTERTITRLNQFGRPVTKTVKPIGNGVHNYLKDIRALFRDAMEEFNDEDKNEQIITHYPFNKYKVPKPEQTRKRNIKTDVIKQIRDFKPQKKAELVSLGQDVFMLSFYLVGINLIDLFQVDKLVNGRLTYNRSKTETRRSDKALISIKIEPETLELIKRYADPSGKRVFNFYKRYSSITNFNKAVNNGLKQLSNELELQEAITSYVARHSWATIARNVCKISKDDVDLALNHVDPHHKLADIYIEKDFSMIDESNRKVLDTLRD